MDEQRRKKICALLMLKRLKCKRKRSNYVRKLFLSRYTEGETLLLKHLDEDVFYHHKYYRMNASTLETLMTMVGLHLRTSGGNHLIPITFKQKLVITLRYVATGNSQISMSLAYRISPSAICQFIPEVLDAIILGLQPTSLPPPSVTKWKMNSVDFWNKWNFPNTVGAIDGKHVRIRCPNNTGSNFYNYKKFFSIILLGIADAKYRFSFIDVGAYGSEGDSTIFSKSGVGKQLARGNLMLPSAAPFPTTLGPPKTETQIPFVFIADDAFPLKTNLMKPYSGKKMTLRQRIFNYRLSRARRVVENAFGILAAKFRIFHTAINARPEVVDKIIWATCCLHNFLIDSQGIETTLPDREVGCHFLEGDWREYTLGGSGMSDITHISSNHSSYNSMNVREIFNEFLVSEDGKLSWQEDIVKKGGNC